MKLRFVIAVTATLAIVACSEGGVAGSDIATNQSSGGAPGSLVNQYRQMGSVAGTAEQCYGAKDISEALNPKIRDASGSGVLQSIVDEYNAAYAEGIKKQVVWNGTQGTYSSPFDCASSEDMEMLRNMERTVVAGINGQ